MRKILLASVLSASFTAPILAAEAAPPSTTPQTPAEIVARAPVADWKRIASSDLLVMELAPDAAGKPRRVVMQLMPAPFSQGWVSNIRKLVAARWYDGIAIVRVQDNYVVQWGDPDGETPGKAKPLPKGLTVVPEGEYVAPATGLPKGANGGNDAYAARNGFSAGWPIAGNGKASWPIHCYGMVGVGRNMAPDTGTGAELYVVNGQAPRQLDRNVALVGRVISGMENLSALPRGTGDMGFYKTAQERVPILSVRMGSEVSGLPGYEYLSTESRSFAAYVDKRANRKDDFYVQPAGGVDVCNVPVPIREIK
jgi:peptidylprolyl isomerase